MKAWLIPLLAGPLLALTGCPRHMHLHAPPHPVVHGPRVVVVAPAHVHSATCGHYYHGDSWYYDEGHVHGYGCGHVYHRQYGWVHAEPAVIEHGHVCGHGCSHYHHGGQSYTWQGHRHGHGCGHVLRRGVWIVVN